MAQLSETGILEALKTVRDPEKGADIVALGMISGVLNKDGNVGFTIEVDPERGPHMEPLRKAAEQAVAALDGVLSVTAVLTAAAAPGPAPGTPGPAPGPAPGPGPGPAPGAAPAAAGGQKVLLPGVGAIIAIASGKGGVGKSTTATNLALALAAAGHRTGMLDADIYGPSMPMMLGIHERPTSPDGKRLIPIEKFGLKCMSIGFMVEADSPMIWRGPMVMGALEQMMGDVEWGELDVMVVDMPPGTGDAQLTMAQRVPLAGAVIVSTPQDLALLDARRGLNMFRKVDVPVLGIVENMSYFDCPHCGERSEIFTHGGARKAAESMGVDFLGEIPLDMVIREGSDAGRPIVVAAPDSVHAKAYRAIAEKLWDKVGNRTAEGPRIVVQ
jgi:ATP-binding protein involved in chromosome partitioning